jgi:hypothetical protein
MVAAWLQWEKDEEAAKIHQAVVELVDDLLATVEVKELFD